MIDESCLFDSEGEGEEGAQMRTPAERKFLFLRELRSMLYGFGDSEQPQEDALDMLEEIVVEYIRAMCQTRKAFADVKEW